MMLLFWEVQGREDPWAITPLDKLAAKQDVQRFDAQARALAELASRHLSCL
jgi:hypothetical protein